MPNFQARPRAPPAHPRHHRHNPNIGIIVQGDVGEVAVACEAVPFPVEGGQDFLGGWVRAVEGGLFMADGVHGVQGLVERLACLGVPGTADLGGGHGPVGEVEVRDPRHPLVPPDP